MIGPINIMILCNNELALPAMQQLYMKGNLKAVVVPEENTSLFTLLNQILSGTGVILLHVNKQNLQIKLQTLITENNITTAWMMTFAYIIPNSVLKILQTKFLNFHYGILPKYRGPNPILAQMLHGESESGISVHVVDKKIDNGPMVMQERITIDDRDTLGIQLKKLSFLGASMALRLLEMFTVDSPLPSVKQDQTKASYFKNPVASDLMINWNTMSSWQVIRLINACNPWNKGAGTYINNMGICLTDAEICDDVVTERILPGTIVTLDKLNGLTVYCFDQKLIKINVINLDEGFFAATRLLEFGLKPKDRFLSP